MSEDHKLHVIEPIVTADKYEYGLHRLSVPGGWIYWLNLGGAPLGTFVPLPTEVCQSSAAFGISPENVTLLGGRHFTADEINDLQEVLINKIHPIAADVTNGAS